MATTDAQGPARVSTPRPKAVALASSASSGSISASEPRPSQRPLDAKEGAPGVTGAGAGAGAGAGVGAGARRGARPAAADPLSDRATVFLIKRTLCPQHLDKGKGLSPPIEEILPPLTSRNDVDLQLYALISIILREFVQNWYNKITPDETFVAEIVQIIAHITRTLEQRLRKVDLESLLFDELPNLLDKHITAYRTAHDPPIHHPLTARPQEIYHALCPLPALSPVPSPGDPGSIAAQAKNEATYRQLLVQGVLAILLPTEDLENDCLTALVGQIFSELIIGNAVANKLSEPWMIYEILIIVSRVVLQKRMPGNRGDGTDPPSASRNIFSISALFWTILQWCFLATSFIRTVVAILLASRYVPFRTSRGRGTPSDVTDQKTGLEPVQAAILSETETEQAKAPVLAFRLWAAVSNLIEMDARMPWLHGTLSLLQWIAMTGPGRMADVDGRLDR
ncbi:PXA domain-containing protein [Immersiella caudata]|uniref:PXA domain-containing protein n=1 Tax=Immersiella caudata TaxID=314043 RepID=A0AA40C3H1_9PEZI|nr:PXA domain-containing protein [Immersiella caudata]